MQRGDRPVLALVICVAALVGAARADVLFVDGFEATCAPPPDLEVSERLNLFRFQGGRFQRIGCSVGCTYADWFGAFPGNDGTYRADFSARSVISVPITVTASAFVILTSDETPESLDTSFVTISRCAHGLDFPVLDGPAPGGPCARGGLRSWSLSVGSDPGLVRCAIPPGTYHLVIANPADEGGEVLIDVLPFSQ